MRKFITQSILVLFALVWMPETFAQSSVSWKTTKRMFLLSTQTPVGINRAVEVQTGLNDNRYIRLLIPIDKFDSGEPERDQEVLKLLQANIQPKLIFSTSLMRQAEYDRLVRGDINQLDATLSIAKIEHPVTVEITRTGNFLVGTIKTKFTTFGITPPKVAGGLVAKVNDELELVGRIDLADLK